MKLNMETSYIPVSNIYQIRDMMDSWRVTSERCKFFSCVCAGANIFACLTFAVSSVNIWWIYMINCILFFAGAYLTKNWKYQGFVAVIIASLLGFYPFAFPLPEEIFQIGCVGVLSVAGLVPMLYAYKLIFNHKHIFKELEKLPGFPNFIANTADLYADKMYLKDKKAKDKTLYDNKIEVSYNPFNTEEENKAELFKRQQEYKEEKVPERLEKNITVDSVDGKTPEKPREKTYKYGKSIFGRWLIFPHNAWRNDEFEEKKDWMGYWRANSWYPSERFVYFMYLMIFDGLVVIWMENDSGRFLLCALVILLSMLGTNQMKMDKWYGGVITLVAVLLGFYANYIDGLKASAPMLLIYSCALLSNIGIIFGTIRFLLNYPTYKQLSVMEGFPTFIRTTADLYGDKMYIVEKPKPIERKDPSQRQVKVMDIGYDEPKKEEKQDKGWNAFDYMDETE